MQDIKSEYDQNYFHGLSLLHQYTAEGKIREWVTTFCPFFTKDVQESLIICLQDEYKHKTNSNPLGQSNN